MKSIQQWLSEYEVSHQHPTNRAIHKVAIPAIVFSIMLLLWPTKILADSTNAAVLVSLAVLFYYALLSLRLCVGMLVTLSLMAGGITLLEPSWGAHLWHLGLTIFIVAWIFQFIGHKIEGKKPSFFQDLFFLLIGPLWTLSTFYKKFGIRP